MRNKDRVRGSFIRMCAGCSERKNKSELIRICAVDGVVKTDGSEDGRGAYICKNAECLAKLRKSGRLAKLLRCRVGDEIYTELEKKID